MSGFWNQRRVLVTGHTGFKGAWLTLWLRLLGAEVTGIALEPEQPPGLLDQFELTSEIDHNIMDIRDAERLSQKIAALQPEFIFHLAAQPLVRRSYQHPTDTWSTNVTGTINLMEASRQLTSPWVAIMITTDKVYLNREWEHGYRESDPLGGYDPYSSSKAAAEVAVASWRQSYFTDPRRSAIASVRAGNVLGGGDWAEDRIFPDIVRNLRLGKKIIVRNPNSTRPWQHVLEPLSGYLRLAERLKQLQQSKDVESLNEFSSAWNFGPLPESNRSVRELVETALEFWPGTWADQSEADSLHEAGFLGLSIDKACRSLEWYPRWNFRECIGATIQWYRRTSEGEHPREVAVEQIREYECISPS